MMFPDHNLKSVVPAFRNIVGACSSLEHCVILIPQRRAVMRGHVSGPEFSEIGKVVLENLIGKIKNWKKLFWKFLLLEKIFLENKTVGKKILAKMYPNLFNSF